MKRAKGEDGSKSIDRISELPQGILQQILYFLSQQEAVRTSVLSKSWRHVWYTRPNLDFSYITFKGNKQKFLSVLNNTLKRYCDQRLSLEEFDLSIRLGDCLDKRSVFLLEKWIPMLTNMGVKKFCLSISSRHCHQTSIDLPSVVSGSESLQDLHVKGFVLDQKAIQRIVVLFKHLKRFCLEGVVIDDQSFEKIISNCPLIETLHVVECEGLTNIKVNDLPNLKDFSFSDAETNNPFWGDELCRIEIQYPKSLEIIKIKDCNIWFEKGADFVNLICLSLDGVHSSLEHLSACKFPSLEDLILCHCNGLRESHIFIDAPNLVLLRYDGTFSPSISFATTKWKHSDIHLTYSYLGIVEGFSWFLELNELLKSLCQSKVSLSISCTDSKMKMKHAHEDALQENIELQHIESLHLGLGCPSSSNFTSLLNGALSICRPRNIDEYDGRRWNLHATKNLWKILIERESEHKNDKLRRLWLQDLEEVSLEVEETNRKKWRKITTLSELPSFKQRENIHTRFALKWRQIL